MDILKDLGIGVPVGVPLADKQSLIDNYNAPFAMPSKLGYQVTYSDPVTVNRADTTVVSSTYDTSGNGGRKLVRLSNGWLVSIASSVAPSGSYDHSYLYVSKNNGETWSQLCSIKRVFNTNSTSILDMASLASYKNYVYILYKDSDNTSNFITINTETQTNIEITTKTTLDTQNSVGSTSLAINPQGTELHATWSSKNATYPNSSNIRYVKGTIALDGSVTWGSVVQLTNSNTAGHYCQNPTITLNGNNPNVIFEYYNSANYMILLATKAFTTHYWVVLPSDWGEKVIYDGTTRAQSSPSAIFVPQSVNGLTNGRIWVAWHGRLDLIASNTSIIASYSDDGGVTWSTPITIMQSSDSVYSIYTNPSISVNANNEIYVLANYRVSSATGYYEIANVKYTNSVWSSVTQITTSNNATIKNPSTILDTTLNFSVPLFMYGNVAKVGFYGTWNDVIATESINYSSVNLKNLVQTINTSGRLALYGTKKWARITIPNQSAPANSSVVYTVSGLSFIPSYIIVTSNTSENASPIPNNFMYYKNDSGNWIKNSVRSDMYFISLDNTPSTSFNLRFYQTNGYLVNYRDTVCWVFE